MQLSLCFIIIEAQEKKTNEREMEWKSVEFK